MSGPDFTILTLQQDSAGNFKPILIREQYRPRPWRGAGQSLVLILGCTPLWVGPLPISDLYLYFTPF